METANYVARIGGDWSRLVPVFLDDIEVDIFRSEGKNCTIDIAVYKGVVYLRAQDGEKVYRVEYEQYTEDDGVLGVLNTLRTTGLIED